MPQLSQTGSSEQASAAAECATRGFTNKPTEGVKPIQPHHSPAQNAGLETEYLLKLVASLESCNMALLNKLNHAEKELAALRQSPTDTLKKTESTYNPEQSYGWERKLTRLKWQPI